MPFHPHANPQKTRHEAQKANIIYDYLWLWFARAREGARPRARGEEEGKRQEQQIARHPPTSIRLSSQTHIPSNYTELAGHGNLFPITTHGTSGERADAGDRANGLGCKTTTREIFQRQASQAHGYAITVGTALAAIPGSSWSRV